MKAAFLIILVVQLAFTAWADRLTFLHDQREIGDGLYFLAIIPGAAIVDYIALSFLVALKWGKAVFTYMHWLAFFLACSVFSHVIGAYAFIAGIDWLLLAYDIIGVSLLLAELGVFVKYGMDNILSWATDNSSTGH